MKKLLCFSFFLLNVQLLMAQAPAAEKANYQLASKFSPKKLGKMVFSTSVSPHWFKKSDRFWYMYETTSGRKWYLVNPATREKKEMFDLEKLAAQLTQIVKDPFDAQHLPIDSLRLTESENGMRFEIKSTIDEERKDTTVRRGTPQPRGKKIFYFEYTFSTGQLQELKEFKKPARRPNWASVSPDSSTIIFARNYNLYKMDKANYEKALKNESDSTIVETQLTKDGIEFFAYGGGEKDDDNASDSTKAKPKRRAAYVLWSPDSKKFAMVRSDTRKLKEMWVINSVADPRPTLKTYKYQLPGEKEAPDEFVLLFDAATGNQQALAVSAFKNQDVGIWSSNFKQNERDDDWRPLTWLGTKDKFYLNRTSRDLKRIDVVSIDVATGTPKVLIEERMNTYVEIRKLGLVNDGKELIQWSERDGWGHFYLYDGNGTLKNQITSGAFHCEDIVGIDEKKRVLYFSANGREGKEDPYYLHLYKINFDGSGLTLLNAGDFDHNMSLNDNNTFFVDNYSRVNTVPKSALYDANGKK
ncbi:DPP IV N-terminal domain-containing protein [Chitinophaga sedimenti]|uniref:DPP IV N-terminal domain-containing protein n=1 Tax=Chitinophaga sedimenti TaxID=2033606 RepID=UPI002004DFFA|nr:DPP IV N-terminal domain-containing protein [Chitinophaga sedimenti]MCK7554515.1 DPP IV N-terminal domain-containing protein [Chitinophaga sedimenti]